MKNYIIMFNGFTLWNIDELNNYLKSINQNGLKEGEKLYFSSNSQFANYNFEVTRIMKNDIDLMAIAE